MDKNFDTVIIGHVTMDINTDCEGNVVREAGGAVLYSSAAAYSAGRKVLAVTKTAKTDDRTKSFILPEDNIIDLPSQSGTDMENTYFTPDKERRKCVCNARGDAFTCGDIPEVETDVYHLAGLLYGDYDNALPKFLADKGKLAIDVQGYLRRCSDSGEMYFDDWTEKKEILPFVTYLKTDAAEAEILTGLADREEAAKTLYSWGAKEVFITHNSEILAYDGKEVYTCPIKSRNLSGRTGRGDTSFAIYVTERKEKSVKDALLYATAAVSMKMEKRGVLNCTRADIDGYIEQFYI